MGILRSQLVNMNQHYRRFSLDYFLTVSSGWASARSSFGAVPPTSGWTTRAPATSPL